MRAIYKYPLFYDQAQAVRMPKDAIVLSVQEQRGILCLWAIVDIEAEEEERHIVIYGSGHPLPDGYDRENYIGSVLVDDGSFVWHIFEHLKL